MRSPGIPHGVPNATGTGKVAGGQQVSLGVTPPPARAKPAAVASTSPGKAVTVISKPKPEYTAEARQMHIEGVVTLRIRVSPSGAVEVVGVAKPLGYGLDDSAKRAIMATKFQPATDSTGQPDPLGRTRQRYLPVGWVAPQPSFVLQEHLTFH